MPSRKMRIDVLLLLLLLLETPLTSSMPLKPSTLSPYALPSWAAKHFKIVPEHGRLFLANLPTPLYQVIDGDSSKLANKSQPITSKFQRNGCNLYIKRDDSTGGAEIGGNKIRKLEFLLADAIAKNCNAVITIGGEQSNHCRATAAACRMVDSNIEPHLILRCSRKKSGSKDEIEMKEGFGYVGNILFDRLCGSHIYTCTIGEYGRFGSAHLTHIVSEKLISQGKKPYKIPVGGSNALGTYGYIEACSELSKQADISEFDHVVFATGSGGTATGIALGILLYCHEKGIRPPKIHAVAVCDDQGMLLLLIGFSFLVKKMLSQDSIFLYIKILTLLDKLTEYFYKTMTEIAYDMGFRPPSQSFFNEEDNDHKQYIQQQIIEFFRENITIHQGKGKGYAISTAEELNFCSQFARETGKLKNIRVLLILDLFFS